MFSYRLSTKRIIQFEALEPRRMYDASPAVPTDQFIQDSDHSAVETFRVNEKSALSFSYYPKGGAGHWFQYVQSVTRNGLPLWWSPDPTKIDWSDRTGKIESQDFVWCGGGWLDNGVYTFTITWKRDDGLRGQASITGVIENDPPAIAIEGPDTATTGQQISLTARPPIISDGYRWDIDTDEDYAAGLTYHIDWDGDGVVDEQFHQPESTYGPGMGYLNAFSSLSHQYERPGTYAVHITAEDKDGGVSSVVTHQIVVTGPDLSPHNNNNTPVVPAPVMPTAPQDDPASKGAQKADAPLARFIAPPSSKTFMSPFAKTVEFDLDQLTQNNDA